MTSAPGAVAGGLGSSGQVWVWVGTLGGAAALY